VGLFQDHTAGEHGQHSGLWEDRLGELLEEEEAVAFLAGRCRHDDALEGGLPHDGLGSGGDGVGVREGEAAADEAGVCGDLQGRERGA